MSINVAIRVVAVSFRDAVNYDLFGCTALKATQIRVATYPPTIIRAYDPLVGTANSTPCLEVAALKRRRSTRDSDPRGEQCLR